MGARTGGELRRGLHAHRDTTTVREERDDRWTDDECVHPVTRWRLPVSEWTGSENAVSVCVVCFMLARLVPHENSQTAVAPHRKKADVNVCLLPDEKDAYNGTVGKL